MHGSPWEKEIRVDRGHGKMLMENHVGTGKGDRVEEVWGEIVTWRPKNVSLFPPCLKVRVETDFCFLQGYSLFLSQTKALP